MEVTTPSWLLHLAAGSGFTTLVDSSRDTKLLCLQRFVRLFAYGASFLILVDFLSSKDLSDEAIGLFMTLTLLGDVVISVILTSITDQVGRRRAHGVHRLDDVGELRPWLDQKHRLLRHPMVISFS